LCISGSTDFALGIRLLFLLIGVKSNIMHIPTCSRCGQAVTLESSKTDEHGQAIHEECCAIAMKAQNQPSQIAPPASITNPA
jgi:hypothetical protein